MTLLIASLFVDELADAARRSELAFAAGADAVELRIDGWEGDAAPLAAYLKSQPHRRWIVTCRSAEQGGSFRGDTMQRVSLLIAAARDTGAFVDFEWADWKRSANIRQKVLLACTPVVGGPPRLILSHHDFSGMPADPRGLVTEIQRACPAVVKLAWRAKNADDGFLAFDLMREFGAGIIAVAMGAEGAFTRILAHKFGAWGTYAALGRGPTTAPGQFTIDQMLSLYRWPHINRDTKFYGVIGDPIAHSLSPLLHNAWFARHGIKAVYVPLLVHAAENGLARFFDACAARPWLDVGGFSVTAPHKEALFSWAGERCDRLARNLGAANTLVSSPDEICVYNTDAHAAVEALCAALKIEPRELRRYSVDILGAGGTGRALAITLGGLGCRVTVFDRNETRAQPVAAQAGGSAKPWIEAAHGDGDILINATSITASPDGADFLPRATFEHRKLVFDVNYRPAQTAFVRAAAAARVPTCNGLEMFLRQATMQFALWTGASPDVEFGRQLLINALAAERDDAP